MHCLNWIKNIKAMIAPTNEYDGEYFHDKMLQQIH